MGVSMIGLLLISLFIEFQASGPPARESGELWNITRAVTQALEHNLQLIAERANLTVADAQMITARLRPNPSVGLSADHLDLAGTGFSETNGAGPPEYTLNTAFLWERGGKRKRRIDLAREDRRLAEYDFRDLQRRLALEVRSAFVDLLFVQEHRSLARENLSTMTRILEINQARVNSGDLAEVELMRTRVAVAQLEDELTQAESAGAQRAHEAALARRPACGRQPHYGGWAIRERRCAARCRSRSNRARSRRGPTSMAAAAREARAAADVRLQTAQAKGISNWVPSSGASRESTARATRWDSS